MIDFNTINSNLLPGFRSILTQWLPGGQFQGEEYTVRNPNRADKTPGSFKINARTGAWSDFAVGTSGGDPISLYAYIHNVNNGKAASELARSLGISTIEEQSGTPRKKNTPIQYIDIIYPAPTDAPPPPTEKNIKTDDGAWHKYPIKYTWAYRNQLGQLLGYVVRYETETGKETPPITLWRTADHGLRWRYKSFQDPRPLFHLDKLALSPEAQVIIVEGEKCAETLQGLIESAGAGSKLVSVSWPGGAKSIQKADWSPLRSRRAVLWPDFDLQCDESGKLLPFNKQPGMDAMLRIAGIIRGLDSSAQLRIISQIPGKPAGWDVADAILNDGWTLQEIIGFIREHSQTCDVKPVQIKNKPERSTAACVPGQSGASTGTTASTQDGYKPPFRPLGYRGDYSYYLPSATRQVKAIKTSDHSSGALLTLAPLTYWERAFIDRSGPNWKLAADTFIRLCERAGVYDPLKQRGRGGWYDNGRAVLHLGDRLIIDGKQTQLDEIKSEYIYEAGPTIEYSSSEPLSVKEAHRLREITDMLFWSKPIYASYLAGWCFISTICGCLRNRPHVWITGGAGTGKSYVVDNIVRPTLGSFGLFIQHESTAAGVRQQLGCDALPVMVDEFEGEDFASQARQQSMLELARQAFSDTGASIVKGSQGGKAVAYQIRSTFCFSSIGVNITQHADETRIMVLSLEKPYDRENMTAGEHFAVLKREASETLTPKWCAGLRARALKMIPIVRENAEIFACVVGEKLKSRRIGDQVGALLAGAWALSSDDIITVEQAQKWVDNQDWSEQENVIQDTDESNLLTAILSEITFVGKDCRSIGEIIQNIYDVESGKSNGYDSYGTPVIDTKQGKDSLLRIGIRYEQESNRVYFGSYHPSLRRILEKTPWSKTYSRILKRIPDVEIKRMRFHGTALDGLGIPFERIMDL